MNVLQGINRHRALVRALGHDIHDLSADQPLAPDALSDVDDHSKHFIRAHPFRFSSDVLKRVTQQRVTGQNRHLLSVHLVIRRLAAAKVVVIHARQIVVDQRHGVNHLEGDRRWHGMLRIATRQFTGRKAKNRAQTL